MPSNFGRKSLKTKKSDPHKVTHFFEAQCCPSGRLFGERSAQSGLLEQRQDVPNEPLHAIHVINPGHDDSVDAHAGDLFELLGDALGRAGQRVSGASRSDPMGILFSALMVRIRLSITSVSRYSSE